MVLIEVTVALHGERTLTVTLPGSPPLYLQSRSATSASA